MSIWNFMLNWVEHKKSFITSGPGFQNSLRLRRRELILCDLPSNIMYNMRYFHGYGKIFIRIIG